jgi:hypothetical protein
MMINQETLRQPDLKTLAQTEKAIKAGDSQAPEVKGNSHVVAILPRGEAIRNFVYTGALDEIGRRAEVTLLTVLPSNELEEEFRSRYHNTYQLREIAERWSVGFLREILDMAHGRWLWSEAAQERWRLRDAEARGPRAWLKRRAKKLACLPFASRAGLSLLSRIERLASRSLRTTEEYTELFGRIRPSLVFNGSHVHSQVAMQAVQAAQWLGIPTATFIFSWDNLTSQGRIMPPYDYYLVWNEDIRDQLLKLYGSIRPEQVFVTGTPQFDFHFRPEFHWSREEFCSRVGADPERPIVLYSTGMANHMPEEPSIVEDLHTLLKEMTEFGSPQLLVRVYPKDRTGRFEALKQKCPDILFPEVPWEAAWLTPKMEDNYLLTNTLRHVAAGVNVASTISLELCMFDKPVINVGYNPPGVDSREVDYARYYEFDHYRPVVASGAVDVAYSREQLRQAVRQALLQPEQRSDARKALLHQFFRNSLDGWSSTRVASILELILSKNKATHIQSQRFPGERLNSSVDYLQP